MKNFVTGMLSLIVLCCFSFTYAKTGDLNVTYVNQRISSCNPNQSKEVDYYITGTSYTVYPLDNFRSDNLGNLLIGGKNNGSSIDIRSNGVISNCDDWWRASFVAPNKMWVRVFQNYDGCTFKIGKQSTDFVAQIHYNVWYKKIKSCSSNDPSVNGPLSYFPKDSTDYEYYGNSNQTICYNNTLYIHTWECLNYRIFRCWDGLINWHNGKTSYNNGTFVEQCDPKAEPWISNKACDPVTCKETAPKCNSSYNWQTVTSLVEWSYLCEVWSVSDFVYDEITHMWTWKCQNKAGTPVECYAKKPYKGELNVKKELLGTQYVTSEWEELRWQITVTAEWWDVNNVVIKDKLPKTSDWRWILSYVNYSQNLPEGVNMNANQPERKDNGLVLERHTTWTLKSGQSIILIVTTKVEIMPDKDWYENIACASAELVPEDCKPVPINTSWKIEVKKEVVVPADNIVTKTWESVEWKITVKAIGWDVEMKYIEDTLPDELVYDSYKKEHVPAWITIYDPENPGKVITWKTTWTLKSWEYIELRLYTKVVKMPQEQVKNIACAIPVTWWKECWTWSTTKLWIQKYILDGDNEVKNITLQPWDYIVYKIKFGNEGNKDVYVSIKDFLPKGVTFLSGILNITYSSQGQQHWWWIVSYNWQNITIEWIDVALYSWIFLRGGYEWELIIYAQIPESVTDEGLDTTNFACIYNQSGTRVDCDNAVYSVEKPKNLCENLDITTKTFTRDGWSTTVKCTASKKANIVIDCGNGKQLTDSNVSILRWTCTYPSNSSSSEKTYKVECKVNNEAPVDDCKWSVIVEENPNPGKDYAICKEKYKDGAYVGCRATDSRAHFKLECGNKTYYYDDSREWKHTFKECKNDENATCYVKWPDDSMWKTSRKCGNDTPYCESHPDDPICDLADPQCLNINAWNFSIESGEYLPFYFNVRRDKEPSHKFKFVKNESESCNEWDVDLWSLKCEYLIRSPERNKIVYSGKDNCLELGDERYANDNLIKQWANKQKDDYNIKVRDTTYWRYWPHIEFTKSDTWNTNDILWEYKFQIEVNEYKQCNGEWKRETIKKQDAAVCQSNFVLTEPYTVQKTPSGNLTASTRTLFKFRQVDGFKPFSEYLAGIDTSEYSPNQKVADAMDEFIKKYEKLAVNVTTNKFWKKSTTTVKKVPWKDIYFVNGDITFRQAANTINKAFTIVQTNWSTTIDGDLKYNMMLLTKGDIKFSWDCTTNQTVKWIFYAGGQLIRIWVLHNNDLSNNVWCTKGWLNVKWVLIWNNFEKTLMKKSRSHLETWFYGDGKSAKSIMNWASVLIEYSPSIFTKSTMPPGAEDFTTALSIYKQ